VFGEHGQRDDEGMAKYAKEMRDAFVREGAAVLDLTHLGSDSPARTAVLRPPVLRRMARFRPDLLYYVPRSGLTSAAVVRGYLVRTAVRTPLVFVALQADDRIPRCAGSVGADLFLALDHRVVETLRDRGARAARAEAGVERVFIPPARRTANYGPRGRARVFSMSAP
jgi:hypothetical protein